MSVRSSEAYFEIHYANLTTRDGADAMSGCVHIVTAEGDRAGLYSMTRVPEKTTGK